jgi:methylmalonyl-CoA mutase
MSEQNLFSEFSTTSKADWLKRIEKDLKGRPISELVWEIPNMSIDSFAHADDFEESYPVITNKTHNEWLICESIHIQDKDFKKANQKALNALMGGANTLNFIVSDYPSESQLSILLEDVELGYIAIYFNEITGNISPLLFLKSFKKVVDKKNEKVDLMASILRGGILYDPFADGRYDVKTVIDVIEWANVNIPEFKVLTLNASRFFKGSENVVEELTNVLVAANAYIQKLKEKGLDVSLLGQKIVFRFDIGLSYFIEIAKLRAFKLLWGNLLQAYNLEAEIPFLWAFISPATQADNVHTNKIRATTQAMSAVFGGIDVLSIAPSDALERESSDLSYRVARNVQHLLQMESYMDKVADPAAGSYYIEKLTDDLAEVAWSKFQERS